MYISVIFLLHESEFRIDNRSDNRGDFLLAQYVRRKSRRLFARVSARLTSIRRAITDARRLIDIYPLIWISSARVCCVCYNIHHHVSKFMDARSGTIPACRLLNVHTSSWVQEVAPTARWLVHTSTLNSRLLTLDSRLVGGRLTKQNCK